MGDDGASGDRQDRESDATPDIDSRPDGGSVDPAVLPRFEGEEESVPRSVIDEKVIPRFETPMEVIRRGASSTLRSRVTEMQSEPQDAIPDRVLPIFEDPEATRTGEVERIVEDDDEFVIGGPEYDEEMPLADHIEEMIKRLAVVVVVAGAVTLVTFPFAEQIIVHLWYAMLPGGGEADPRIYHPLEFLLTQIKVASLMGLVVALPALVYETYAFMRPGLYRHERRYYLAAVPTSLVLAIIGMAFAYFIVLPAIFTYFMAYSADAGEIAFALGQTFELILVLMAYLAIVFQIPLFMMLAIMMGLTTRRWLADKRLYFWGAFLGLSFITSPDPTGMAPIIIALTMVGLFEGTLVLLKWTGR